MTDSAQPEGVIKKIVLLGDSAVGKTSLIQRFVKDLFDDEYISTIGTKVSKHTIQVELDGKQYEAKLMVWDIIGSQGFESSQSRHMAGLNGAILVADLTRQETIDSLENYWIPLLREVMGDIMPPLLFLGNKLDLVEDKAILKDFVDQFSELDSKFCPDLDEMEAFNRWFFTSAKSGERVGAGFETLAKVMIMLHPSYEPMTRQMEELIADSIYARTERDNPRAVLDMMILDFPYVVHSTEMSSTIFEECVTKLGINKEKLSVDDVRKIADSVLSRAVAEGGSDDQILKYRKKWVEHLDALEK